MHNIPKEEGVDEFETALEAWRSNLNAVEDHFERVIFALKASDEQAMTEQHRDDIRRYWKSAADLLHEFIIFTNRFGKQPDPFPDLLLTRLARELGELGQGIVDPIIDCAREGGRPRRWFERQQIAKAIYFLEAVASGQIFCKAPVKTVADCYDVTKQAVRKWRDEKDKICHGVPRPHPNMIEEAMRSAGKKYRVLGRGAPSA